MGFLEDYFINPIMSESGYNLYNTLAYAAILIIALFAVARLLKHMKVKLDARFFYNLLPFVFLGGVLRALQDWNFFAGLGPFQYFFVTPLIYFLLFFLVLGTILISKKLKRDLIGQAGMVLLVIFSAAAAVSARNWMYFAIAAGLAALAFLIVFLFIRTFNTDFLSGIKKWPLLAHVLDSCSSVTAVSIVGTFHEQHVLPSYIFSFIPFWLFIPLKVTLALAAIYLINKETKKEWNWMLLFAVTVLGLGPGVRNAVALLW